MQSPTQSPKWVFPNDDDFKGFNSDPSVKTIDVYIPPPKAPQTDLNDFDPSLFYLPPLSARNFDGYTSGPLNTAPTPGKWLLPLHPAEEDPFWLERHPLGVLLPPYEPLRPSQQDGMDVDYTKFSGQFAGMQASLLQVNMDYDPTLSLMGANLVHTPPPTFQDPQEFLSYPWTHTAETYLPMPPASPPPEDNPRTSLSPRRSARLSSRLEVAETAGRAGSVEYDDEQDGDFEMEDENTEIIAVFTPSDSVGPEGEASLPYERINGTNHRCMCGAVFETKRYWERHHCQYKAKQQHPCSFCGKILSRKDALIRHQRTSCQGQL